MNRRMGWSLVGVCVGLACVAGLAVAEENAAPTADTTVTPATSTPGAVAAQTPDPAQAKREKLKAEFRARLDGTSWALELRRVGGGKKSLKDTLTFQGGTVTSQRLSKAGYTTSNVSLIVDSDDMVIWQTMQMKEGKGRVFWRGQLQDENEMDGLMNQQPQEGQQEEFVFTASRIEVGAGVEPPSGDAQAPQAESSQPAPQAVAQKDDTTPKKKRGRFW